MLTAEPSPTATLPATATPIRFTVTAPTATPAQLSFDKPDPRFADAPCPFSWTVDRPVRCGFLTVPERRDGNPVPTDPATLRLPVAIFASDVEPAPDPVLLLYGAQGPAPILEEAAIYVLDRLQPLLATRELIVMDIRGVGRAEPALACPEVARFSAAPESERAPPDEWFAGWQAAQEACQTRLRSAGIAVAAYDSRAAAADVHELQSALGYPQINLLGVGYGSRVALAALAQPAGIRAVVLDSPFPPEAAQPDALSAALTRALNALVTRCAAQESCAAAYPELADQISAALERLASEPLEVRLPQGETVIQLDAWRFVELLRDAFSYPPALPTLPLLLAEVAAGETTLLGTYLESVPRSAPAAGSAAGLCDGWSAPEVAEESTVALLAGAEPAGAALAALCIGAVRRAPAALPSVPLLLLTGIYDPLTDPAWAAAFVAAGTDRYQLILPGVGFGVIRADRCGGRLTASFLADPTRPPPTDCVENSLVPLFVVPGE